MCNMVLICDDSNSYRSQIKKELSQRFPNANFLLAKNGRMADEMLQLNPEIDLLITDMVMDEMDGRALVEKLKQGENKSEIPIIMVSSIKTHKDISDLLDIGASYFLPKPIDFDEMGHYIQNCLMSEAD